MAYSEIPFETFSAALETTRGTAITPPTHRFNLAGIVKPVMEEFRPDDRVGQLETGQRSEIVRDDSSIEAEGGVDPNQLQFWFEMMVKGGVTPTTPTNGVLTRLWTYVPTATADNLKSGTFYGGDPGGSVFLQAPYVMLDEISVESDASGTDGVTMSVKGTGRSVTKLATPVVPAAVVGPLLIPGKMQLWIDTSSAIGTTEITGRFVAATVTMMSAVSYKHLARGPVANPTFDHIGRDVRHMELGLKFEVADAVQYDLWKAHTTLKTRLRLNGPLIESVTPDYYYYAQWDCYGPFKADMDFGDLEGTNRTIELSIQSEYNATLGASWAAYVQNIKTAV